MTSAFSKSFSDPFTETVTSFDWGGIKRAVKYSPPNENHLISPFSVISKGSIVVFFWDPQLGTQPDVDADPNSFFSTFWFLRKAYFNPKSLLSSLANFASSTSPIHSRPN